MINDLFPIQDYAAFRSIGEIITDLKKPIALKHLGKRQQGGKQILFISWTDACKYMDYYANGWSYEIKDMTSIAGKLIITVRVTIPAKEGLFYREATGQEDETTDSWGDSSSNAESQALRRACAKFGLCQYLYDISDQEKAQLLSGKQIEVKTPPPITPDSNKTPPNAPETPETTSSASKGKTEIPESDTVATGDQVETLTMLAKKAKRSMIDIVQKYTNGRCEVFEDMSGKEAQTAIDAISELLQSKK